MKKIKNFVIITKAYALSYFDTLRNIDLNPNYMSFGVRCTMFQGKDCIKTRKEYENDVFEIDKKYFEYFERPDYRRKKVQNILQNLSWRLQLIDLAFRISKSKHENIF